MLAVLLGLLLAGCASEPGPTTVARPVADDQRDAGEFWMVWVHGNETWRQTSQGMSAQAMCSVLFSHRLDPARATVRYDGGRYDFEPEAVGVVVAFDHWERPSHCPLAYELHADPGTLSQPMGRYGTLDLQVHDDGDLLVNDEPVALGSAARYTYQGTAQQHGETYRYEGTFVVENLGAWPSRSLMAD